MLSPWFAQQFPSDNPAAALKNLLYHLDVPVTSTGIENATRHHVEYPALSLQALRDILAGWHVETLPVRITTEELAHIRLPALAYLPFNQGAFVVLYQLVDRELMYIHPHSGWIRASVEQFAEQWQGIILLANPLSGAGEEDYARKKQEEEVRKKLNPRMKKVQILGNFLSGPECNYLIELATSRFAPSQVMDKGAVTAHRGRTSRTAMLPFGEDQQLNRIYQRVSEWLGIPTDYFEYFQCVAYGPGQEYQAHFDTIDADSPLGMEEVALRGQRALTLLVYLNEGFEGGETFFPLLDLKVQPQQGKALLFNLLDENEKVDKFAWHAGLPIFSGQKFALNLWIRNRPFRNQKGS